MEKPSPDNERKGLEVGQRLKIETRYAMRYAPCAMRRYLERPPLIVLRREIILQPQEGPGSKTDGGPREDFKEKCWIVSLKKAWIRPSSGVTSAGSLKNNLK